MIILNLTIMVKQNHTIHLNPQIETSMHSFFVRIIKQWNALRKKIVHEQDFSIFRSRLKKSCKI